MVTFELVSLQLTGRAQERAPLVRKFGRRPVRSVWRPGAALTSPGSNQHAARIATGELLRQGWSPLEALVGGYVASFGGVCWQTDAQFGDVLRRPDGRAYDPESSATNVDGTPRDVSARAIVEPVRMPAPLPDPEFERIIGGLRTLSERRQARETAGARAGQVAGCALAPERPPPE